MPFTESPSESTYSSEPIDLTKEIISRAGNTNKDEDFVNILLEATRSKANVYDRDVRKFLLKRAGSNLVIPSISTGTIRGSIYWTDQSTLYYCIGTTIYTWNAVTTATHTIASGFTTSTGIVGFAEYIFDDGTSVMLASDGVTLIQITPITNFVTPCTDADMPTPHDPNILFFDGYVVMVKVGTGDIYNSDANTPLSWTAGNFINAEIEADVVKRLGKVNNYFLAFGSETIEYFWDAGVATGSPFQRNDTPVKYITYLTGYAQEQNNSYFIGRDRNGDIGVFKLSDFKCDMVSSASVSRYLNTLGTDYSQWYGSVVAYLGHKFYYINAGTKTYCMDIDNEVWTRVSFQTNSNFNMLRAHGFNSGNTAFTSIFTLNDGTGVWYKFDETLYQDNGVNFSCIIVTDSYDFGTLNRKNMHRLSFYADRPPINSNIIIQWTDDDYQTYNTGVSVNLNQDLACIRQLGNFRQRCFRLTYTDNTLLRIQGMVADINKGST